MPASFSGALHLSAKFDDACETISRELGGVKASRIHDEAYKLADGTRAREWFIVVGPSIGMVWHGVFVRAQSAKSGTQVALHSAGASGLFGFDAGGNQRIVKRLSRRLAGTTP